MSTTPKAPEVDLVQQLADIRSKLTEERRALLERVDVINKALGFDPQTATAAPKPRAPRRPGVGADVIDFLKQHPASTIKAIQEGLSQHPAASVESTVRSLAAGGKISKDDQTPRHFSARADSPELPETPVRSSGAAQPQKGKS